MARNTSRAVRPFSASSSQPNSKSNSSRKRSKGHANGVNGNGNGNDQVGGGDDTYTFIPSLPKRHRTSAQTLSLSREEAKAGPSTRRRAAPRGGDDDDDEDGDGDEDEEEDMEARVRRLAMMIAQDDLEEVDDDEESSIASDEAWEEDGSDEDRWGDVFRDMDRGKKGKANGKSKAKEVVKKPAIPLNINLDESDEEEIQTDRKGKAKATAKSKSQKKTEPQQEDSDLGSEEGALSLNEFEEEAELSPNEFEQGEDDDDELDEEDATDGEEDQSEGSSDEDVDEEESDGDEDPELPSDLSDQDEEDEEGAVTLDGLDAFVDRLTAESKKTEGDKGAAGGSAEKMSDKKRRVLASVPAPAIDGNDLGLKSGQKIDLETLIASHPSLASASALLPKQSKKVKAPASSTSILKQGVMSAPLPTSVQERLNREAAYEATKEEGAKWAGVMKRIKEAQHLSFPLQAGDRGGVKSNGEMLASFKPQAGLESAVQSLLAKANLSEEGVTQRENEALEAQDLSIEEIEARRKKMREQRELMFRAEARAKRVAKIKSRTFRKLARKRAARAGGEAGGGEEALEQMDDEERREAIEKLESQRARERATLKHGARTSRWARQAGANGMGLGEEGRSAKEEMLNLKEKLSRRIHGKGSDDDDDDSDGDSSDDDDGDGEEQDEQGIKNRAFDQLAKVDARVGEDDDEGSGDGLMGMAFMKKARERQRRRAVEEGEGLKRDIEMFGDLGQGDDGSASDAGHGGRDAPGSGGEDIHGQDGGDADDGVMMNVGSTGGRMVFSGPTATASGKQPAAQRNIPAVTQRPISQPSSSIFSGGAKSVQFEPPTAASAPNASPAPAPLNPWLAAAAASSSSSSGPSRKRQSGIGANSSAADKAVKLLKKAASSSAGKRSAQEEDDRVDITLDTEALLHGGYEDGDGDGAGMGTMPRKKIKLGQRDLIAEAFAGDNVVEDFAAEKARIVAEDAPQVEDTTLVGWGSWGGKGLKKRKSHPSRLITKPGIDPSTRSDATRENVIISEKKDKKASQFLVKDLPYPYTSKAQYEKRFEAPIGGEWNSRSGHQRETLPRVMKKPGAIIEPVRRLF